MMHLKVQKNRLRTHILAVSTVVASLAFMPDALAHCDAVNGPVAEAATDALKEENFDLVTIWVSEEQADPLRKHFEKALPVFQQGGEAQDLAHRYFMENAVRLHREAEGMSYTGLKPAQPLPPDIAAAEKALETGKLDDVTSLLISELEKETAEWLQKARDARKRKDESIEAGREWVDAYVQYVIYVHGLHQKIQAGPAHGVGGQG